MLILVRHGRTELNRDGRLQGRLDPDLDEMGEQQAVDVAAHVRRRYGVDAVVSSSLRRAQQTAAAYELPVVTDDSWIELAYGVYEGVPHADVPSEVWNKWRTDADFVPEGGESLATLDHRVRAACAAFAERAIAENIVVVSHVSPIKSAVAWALGVDITISWSCHLDHAAICRIDLRPDASPLLRSFNEMP